MELGNMFGLFLGHQDDGKKASSSSSSSSSEFEELLPSEDIMDVDVDLPSLLPPPDIQATLGNDPFDLNIDSLVSYLGYDPALSPPESPEDVTVPQENGQIKVELAGNNATKINHANNNLKSDAHSVFQNFEFGLDEIDMSAVPNSPEINSPEIMPAAQQTQFKQSHSPSPQPIISQSETNTQPLPSLIKAATPPGTVPTTHIPKTKANQKTSTATIKSTRGVDSKFKIVPQITVISPSSKRSFNSITSSGGPADTTRERPIDEQALKKQRRMLKNRESAMLSRKRKKAVMEGLESENADLMSDKAALMQDKENLTVQVEHLQTENAQLKEQLSKFQPAAANSSSSSSSVLGALNGNGKTTTLLMCVLCIGLFRVPASSFVPTQSSQLVQSPMPHERFGRTLQAVPMLTPPVAVPKPSSQLSNPSASSSSSASLSSPSPSPSHATELQVHQQLVTRLHNLSRSRMMATSIKDGNNDGTAVTTDLVVGTDGGGGVQHKGHHDWEIPPIFRLPGALTAHQIRSFQKRSDTSYVFCTEVQMIAAATLNADGVPRMSVVMPAPETEPSRTTTNINATTLSLVQIDCNVAGSQAIRLSANSSVVHNNRNRT